MIGTKKLGAIRKQIEEALACHGADPIERLERQIVSAKRKGYPGDGGSQVIPRIASEAETPQAQGGDKNVIGKSGHRK
jgi:hypothetical protein